MPIEPPESPLNGSREFFQSSQVFLNPLANKAGTPLEEELKNDVNLRVLMDEWNLLEEVKAPVVEVPIAAPTINVDDEPGHTPRNKKPKKKKVKKQA